MPLLQTPPTQLGAVAGHTWPHVSRSAVAKSRRASNKVQNLHRTHQALRCWSSSQGVQGAHVVAVATVVHVIVHVCLASGAGGKCAIQRARQRLEPRFGGARRITISAEAGVVGLADAMRIAGICEAAGIKSGL